MGIIIKYVIKSIKEKKFRTFLILFAVALSGALYFASTSLSDSLVEIYTTKMRQNTGNADIMISPKRESPSNFISDAPVQRVKDKTSYIIKSVNGTATYKIGTKEYERINLTGMTIEDYMKMNDLQLIKEQTMGSFESNSIIISQKTAEKYQLDIGDKVELYISGVRRNIIVYGIALPKGIFLDESQESKALISYRSLCDYMETEGRPTRIYVKAAEGVSVEKLLEEISKEYPKYSVNEPFSKAALYDNISMISMPLLLMTFIVTFMSIFIIYSSFKVIMLEKLPTIGTFRSIGASRRMMNQVLLMESLFYGVLGGIAACFFGIGILYIMTQFTTPPEVKAYIEVTINISPIKLIATFILSIVVCLVSSMVPIFKVAKIPLKELVLGNLEKKRKRKIRKDILGAAFIAVAFILPVISSRSLAIVLSILSILLVILGLINILPTLIKYSSGVSEIIFNKLFGNIGSLAVKNIRENRSILNSISLITIGIATLLMINNLSINLNVEIINFYEKSFISDMEVWMNNMDRNAARGLMRHEGVEQICPVYGIYGIEIKELNDRISYVESVQDKSYADYFNHNYQGDSDKMLSELAQGRYIITTVIMKNRYNLQEGDQLTLKFKNGERTYTILGFMNSLMWNGSFGLISENYMKIDAGLNNYQSVFVRTSEKPEEVLQALKKQYVDRYLGGITIKEMLRRNKEDNSQLMSMLVGFSILALIIGVVGVINNLIISFIERKQSIAVLRSVGMSKKQVVQMLFIEALYSGCIGGGVGILGGVMFIKIMPFVLEAMRVPVPVYLVPGILWIYIVGAVLITVIASIVPTRSSSKLNIIEAIKYE